MSSSMDGVRKKGIAMSAIDGMSALLKGRPVVIASHMLPLNDTDCYLILHLVEWVIAY